MWNLRILSRLPSLLLTVYVTSSSTGWTSERFFDPDGYYYPISVSYIDGLRIQRIDVSTLEYYYDGEIHYDRPKPHPPEIHLSLTDKKGEGWVPFLCKNVVINRDKFYIECPKTLVGDVIIDGTYIDKRGQYYNYVTPFETPILRANVKVIDNGSIVHERLYEFGYWEGH